MLIRRIFSWLIAHLFGYRFYDDFSFGQKTIYFFFKLALKTCKVFLKRIVYIYEFYIKNLWIVFWEYWRILANYILRENRRRFQREICFVRVSKNFDEIYFEISRSLVFNSTQLFLNRDLTRDWIAEIHLTEFENWLCSEKIDCVVVEQNFARPSERSRLAFFFFSFFSRQ